MMVTLKLLKKSSLLCCRLLLPSKRVLYFKKDKSVVSRHSNTDVPREDWLLSISEDIQQDRT